MELSYEEIENYLLQIFTGTKYIEINGEFISFKQPNNEIRMKSQLVYEKEYSKAVSDGILPIADLEKLLKERNIFTEKDEKIVKSLQSKIDAQEILLSKTTKVKANADRIKKVIIEYKDKINTILYKKNSKLMMSAETKADEARHNYLCWACSYDEDSVRMWESLPKFLSEVDTEFKLHILSEFLYFFNGIKMPIIRFLARHSLWRIRYVNSQRVSEQLFGIPNVDYSTDQLNIVYWSNYYTNIYEMMPEDRPSDMVIEDDEALDAYMKEFYDERTREAAARKTKSRTKGTMSAFDKEEVIVTQSNELYEDIQYDKPREAQKVKERTDIKKRTKRG